MEKSVLADQESRWRKMVWLRIHTNTLLSGCLNINDLMNNVSTHIKHKFGVQMIVSHGFLIRSSLSWNPSGKLYFSLSDWELWLAIGNQWRWFDFTLSILVTKLHLIADAPDSITVPRLYLKIISYLRNLFQISSNEVRKLDKILRTFWGL